MHAKLPVISVVLKPFIPHDSSLSILCYIFTFFNIIFTKNIHCFSDFNLLHIRDSDISHFLQFTNIA